MSRFPLIRLLSVACVVGAAAAAGCGGSGGGHPVVPTPTPSATGTSFTAQCTNTPTPTPTMPSGTPSNPALAPVCVQSVPEGLAVSVNGSSVGNTPYSFTPNFSNTLNTIVVSPSNGSATYTFTVDQTANLSQELLYNQSADTSGSIGSVTPAGKLRSMKSYRAARMAGPRFGPHHHAGLPQLSSTSIAVFYRTGVLQSSGKQPSDIERAAGAARGTDVGVAHAGIATRIVDVPAGVNPDAFVARFKGRPEVADAQRLHLRYVSSLPRTPAGFVRTPANALRRQNGTRHTRSSTPVTPNDTHFDDYEQWDMYRISALNAWGYTEGNGVQIAVIDTGADLTHKDLSGGKITFSESVLDGVRTVGGTAAQDEDGHGTNVSGIAGADTNNGFGFAGTGFNVGLQIYRIFPYKANATANTGDEAIAIYDAVKNGAKVINLSLGGTQSGGFDPVERDAVEYAIAQNVTVVAAAGNDTYNTIEFPAAYPGVIAVGASALNDSASPMNYGSATEYVASYSNTGPELAVVAPGGDPSGQTDGDALHWIVNLYTNTPLDKSQSCSTPPDCYALFAGTSQATPHVSGTAALMLAVNGNLTPSQILTIVNSTADDISDPKQGHGRLDAYRALAAVEGDQNGLPAPSFLNFRAFAYVPNGGTTPQILNVTYPLGVQVSSSGTFRIVDIPPSSQSYKIGVWYDANGDGQVDAGDWFGSSSTCTSSSPCSSASGIVAAPVASGFVLN